MAFNEDFKTWYLSVDNLKLKIKNHNKSTRKQNEFIDIFQIPNLNFQFEVDWEVHTAIVSSMHQAQVQFPTHMSITECSPGSL